MRARALRRLGLRGDREEEGVGGMAAKRGGEAAAAGGARQFSHVNSITSSVISVDIFRIDN